MEIGDIFRNLQRLSGPLGKGGPTRVSLCDGGVVPAVFKLLVLVGGPGEGMQ